MIRYAVYAYPVDRAAERGSIPYWFPDAATIMEIGDYANVAQAKAKAARHTARYHVGTQVVRLTYDDLGFEVDEQSVRVFTPEGA